MARDVKDVSDLIGSTIGRIAREAAESVPQNGVGSRNGNGALSGARGMAAGAALVAAAPFVAKGATKMVKNAVVKNAVGKPAKDASDEGGGLIEGVKDKVGGGIKDTVAGGVKDAVGKKVDQAGGAAGIAKEAGKSAIPGVGGGGDEKGKKGTPGVGKGRRMPVQQAVDIGVPTSTAYNQWTQFEEWPQFMHRLDQATQEDDCNVSFKTKLWGMSKEFEAEIVEQRPDERIMWTVTSGVSHTGVVTFHQLADRLTRVQVTLDVEPGSLLEKAARGMRHVKRAVRADLHRFKAFIEMQEVETGAWRGTIHNGELVEEHDPNYDKQRDYAEFDDIYEREQSHSPDQVGEEGSSSSGGSSSQRGGSSSSSSSKRASSSSSKRASSSSSKRGSSSSRKRGSSSSSSGRSRSGSSTRGRSKSSSSRGRSRSGGSSQSSSGRKRSSSRS